MRKIQTRVVVCVAGALSVGVMVADRAVNGSALFAAASSSALAAPDADMQAVLDQLAKLGGKPIETLTPAEARKQPTPADAVMALLKQQGKPTTLEPVGKVETRMVGGAAGQIPARVYWPLGDGPFPVLVYFHGGGWVIGSPMVYDSSARALVNLARVVVVSVDYRKGPEHKFPAAHDDAFAAYQWVVQNAAGISGDPKRVAVGGESAGGTLAVTTAMAARDKRASMPRHMLVVYPIAASDTSTKSYREHANAKPLNKAMMEWFFKHALRAAGDRTDPRVNLVGANLKELPDATLIRAEIDPLLSEGEMLADRLNAAGVSTEARTYEGVTHEFFGMGAAVAKAKQAQQYAASRLKAAFGQ